MKKKLMYETPDVEVIELRLEGYLMQSGNNSWDGPATSSTNWGGDDDGNGME